MRFKKLYFFLIFLFAAVLVINLPVLTAFRNQVKYKVKVDIINKNFSKKSVFILNENDLKNAHWIDAHEFILNGEMFDVIVKEKSDDQVLYHCFKDTDENSIRKVQAFIDEHFNFKSVVIPEMGLPKIVFHIPHQFFFDKMETENFKFEKSPFSITEMPLLYFSLKDDYHHKFKIPPENCC